MKTVKLVSLFLVFINTTEISAQEKPQNVYSIVKEYHDFEWYTHQYDLWNKETSTNSQSEIAWLNLYSAARMAKITGTENERETWNSKQKDVVERMQKAIKDTYTYYDILAWEYQVWDAKTQKEQEKVMKYSLKAYSMDKDNPRVYPTLMNIYHVFQENDAKKIEIAKQWKKSTDLSPNLMALAYNMLISTKQNAILLTAGDNDTYPLWVAQSADGFRSDVTVLNLYLIMLPEYRNRMFKKLGIPALDGENVDQLTITNHIIQHKTTHPLYFSNSGILPEDSVIHKNLYNIGVIYAYCEEKLNNEAIIVENMENRLLLDHLRYNYYQSNFPEMDRRHNYTYISALVILFKHYQLIDNKQKELETKELILKVAGNSPYMDEIKKELNLD